MFNDEGGDEESVEEIKEELRGRSEDGEFLDHAQERVEGLETEAEILAEVKHLLDEPYSRAKKIHIYAEEATGERNWMAMTNFRDALDHLSKIFQALEDDDIEKAKANLAEMEAHIYRASYDGAQVVPEKKLSYVSANRVSPTLYAITLLDAPSREEFNTRLEKIKDNMVEGRLQKSSSVGDSVRHMKTAEEHASRLEAKTPSKKEVKYRLIILASAFVTTVSFFLAVAAYTSSSDVPGL